MRHYKGRRYVVYRDPYSAAREAMKAYHDLLARLRTKVETDMCDTGAWIKVADVLPFFTDDKAG